MAPGARRSGPQKGGKKGDVYRIGGVDLPWDPQLDLDAPRPSPLQPESKTLPPKTLSAKEKSEVFHFLTIRDNIRKGPLHAILGDTMRIIKPGASRAASAATVDAFNGMPSYSSRYAPKKYALPQLHTRPFVKEFFPRELWSSIDPGYKEDEKQERLGRNNVKRKTLQIPGYKKAEELIILENEIDDEKGGEGPVKDSEEEDAAEDEVDEAFDEEEEGGDYNAEQYFDDGGDDGGDDYDAGEDGGVDYF